MSSEKEANQFEKGSGDALIAARLPALAKWVPAAMVPPRMAAATETEVSLAPNTPAANAAPAGIRIKVWTASHRLSSHGSLSAPNSTKLMKPLAPITTGLARTAKCSGNATHPAQPATPTRKRTAYKRKPLPHASPAASASSGKKLETGADTTGHFRTPR